MSLCWFCVLKEQGLYWALGSIPCPLCIRSSPGPPSQEAYQACSPSAITDFLAFFSCPDSAKLPCLFFFTLGLCLKVPAGAVRSFVYGSISSLWVSQLLLHPPGPRVWLGPAVVICAPCHTKVSGEEQSAEPGRGCDWQRWSWV